MLTWISLSLPLKIILLTSLGLAASFLVSWFYLGDVENIPENYVVLLARFCHSVRAGLLSPTPKLHYRSLRGH